MSKVEFSILSRREAENLTDKDIDPESTVMISIHGLDEKPANIKLSCPVLYLQFDDIEQNEQSVNSPRSELIKHCFLPFNKEHAKTIFDFVNGKEPKKIIVHCHAGICRSAAVAAAISKIMYNEDDEIFKAKVPNMLVYKTMLEYYFCDQVTPDPHSYIQQINWETNKEKFRL